MVKAPAKPQHREARLPRARPVPPPLVVVARAALDLDPASPVVGYLRAQPAMDRAMRKLQALQLFEQLSAANDELEPLSIGARERAAAMRSGLGTRTVRRIRRGR